MQQKRSRVADVVQSLPAARKGSTHERPDFEVEDIFPGRFHLETDFVKVL